MLNDVNITYYFTEAATDDLNEPRNLEILQFSQQMLKEIERVKKTKNNDSQFEKIMKKYIRVLQYCNSKEEVKKQHRAFHKELHEALKKRGRGHLINVGDDISDDTLLLM